MATAKGAYGRFVSFLFGFKDVPNEISLDYRTKCDNRNNLCFLNRITIFLGFDPDLDVSISNISLRDLAEDYPEINFRIENMETKVVNMGFFSDTRFKIQKFIPRAKDLGDFVILGRDWFSAYEATIKKIMEDEKVNETKQILKFGTKNQETQIDLFFEESIYF